jgi:ankyrin repeat protein
MIVRHQTEPIDAPNFENKNSILHFVALNGHDEVLNQLLDACTELKRVNVNLKNSDGYTPISLAAKGNSC